MLYSDCGKATGILMTGIPTTVKSSFQKTTAPLSRFQNYLSVGGNLLDRLVVDPNSNNILFFGVRSGNGLYTSSDYDSTWSRVSGLSSIGNYAPDPTDSTGYNIDLIGRYCGISFKSTVTRNATGVEYENRSMVTGNGLASRIGPTPAHRLSQRFGACGAGLVAF
ncbi:hypothetical protein BDZ89DRAFT_1109100 [Hymenopellis radicata]|nr:hypothetical protein BDZ89DRAFT_1109100 [Hymenopellis radicata]